jgi:hypothetical protein
VGSQTWNNLLNAGSPWQTTNGTALSASASTATISPQAAGQQDFVLPVQSVAGSGLQWYPGMTLRVRGRGTINSGGTASNLTVFLAAGASGTLATTLSTTAAMALGTGTLTGMGWRLDTLIRCLAIGSSGNTLSCGGELVMTDNTTAAAIGTANGLVWLLPETTTAFNTYTPATALGLRATLSAAFGLIQCNQFTIEQMC